MPNPCKPLILALAMGAVSGISLSAQSGELTGAIKIKAGVTAGNIADDTHENKLVGFGIGGAWSLSSRSAVIGELGYTYFPGSDRVRALPAGFTPTSSSDVRKNILKGVTARVGYRAAISDWGWNWQGGLTIDRFKSVQEAAGNLVSGSTTEAIAATPESTKVMPGAFLGLHKTIGSDFSFEANFLSFGYSQVEWNPALYTGQAAGASSRNRRGMALEVSLGFRF
jgi:hypothetical protein